MQKLVLIASTAFAALTAACSPADGVPVPVVHAVSFTTQVALYPQPAADAADGHVHEYH